MYLKSLELQGFKSFPDKIRLDFDKGLTAVVGPNGSGKSNIADAVRWVLGEQSTRTLRGIKMEDVIFSGTQYRKSVGFAQVTLNVDDSERILNLNEAEISITRKLYRSGDSEYLINGRQVRLKDVIELFMDTGLGRDGYSIIGQGRIAEIVSAKSEERREIFDEAAGISKFRYKKEEAKRRLVSAEDNILRLNDIANELEMRVKPLRLQSEKAASFIRLSERKKELELSLWIKRLDEIKLLLSEIEEKILINSTEYENLDADIIRIEEKIQTCYKGMQDSSVKVEGIQARILETERAKGQITADIAVYENDILHGNDAISSIEKQISNLKLSRGEINEKIDEKKCQIDKLVLEESETHAALGEVTSKLYEILNQAESNNKNQEAISANLNKLYIQQSEHKASIASFNATVDEIKEQIVTYTEQEQDLSVDIDYLKQESLDIIHGLEGINENILEHNNKLLGYSKLHDGKMKRLGEIKSEFEKITFSIKEKQQRKQLLKDLENSMEGFAHSVKEVLKAGKISRIKGICGSVAQLVKVDTHHSLAIETALGGALQNVVVENEDTVKRCIKLLKELKAGRATFLPKTSVNGNKLTEQGLDEQDGYIAIASDIVEFLPEFQGIINSLLGRTIVVENIDVGTVIAKKYNYKFKIVTLDGQVVNAGGSFTGGSSVRSVGVLTRKNEIDELEQSIATLTTGNMDLKAQVDKVQAELNKSTYDIESEQEQINIINGDKIRFEAEQKRVNDMLEHDNIRLDNLSAGILKLKSRLWEQDDKNSNILTQLKNCEVKIAENERLLSETHGDRERGHRKREDYAEQVSQLKIKLVEQNKDKSSLIQSIFEIEANSKALGNDYEGLKQQIVLQNNLIKEKQQLIKQRASQLDNSDVDVDELNKQIRNQQISHSNFEQRATEIRLDLKQQIEVKERFSREDTRLQERKNSIQKDYDGIILELWEQYQLTRSQAAEKILDISDATLALRELNDAKSQIRALGTVNLASIEEYKEVYERYTFMEEQIKDIETSKRELEKLIAELTDVMRKQFAESFERINTNFKLIFVELFGGGKAELTLSNLDDILESGIEINVAPPGKVIKSLSLLSGGEQAFVAIAIYFAILKTKPSPFCILDEIEAALDDVNVTKYASYLRNFTDTTQFILVTHRRGTMDEADILYGVTMQEKGISKLLKMQQSDTATFNT